MADWEQETNLIGLHGKPQEQIHLQIDFLHVCAFRHKLNKTNIIKDKGCFFKLSCD